MRILVIGGSGSGKSRFAEGLASGLSRSGPLLYLATMSAGDGESLERVKRHRAQRAGKGFQTIERPMALDGLQIPQKSVILLEDLGNLAANELYAPGRDQTTALHCMLEGLHHLEIQAQDLVVVGNSVFSDGCQYDPFTMDYLVLLSQVQNNLARRFDRVVEVVCGIPIDWKGRET